MQAKLHNYRRSAHAVTLTLIVALASGCDLVVRSSVEASGTGEPNGASFEPSLSEDGRFMAFTSAASNLVPGDDNSSSDVFVRDHQSGVTELISVNTSGGFANDFSERPDISPDGRYVVFASWASDLVAGDSISTPDVFLRDRQNGTTELISVDSNEIPGTIGSLGGSVSDSGRYVAFQSFDQFENDTNSDWDIYLRDRTLGTTRLMSTDSSNTTAAGASFDPAVSGDGSTVVWWASSDNIVAGDSNGQPDVFWRTTGLLIKLLISQPNGGGQADGGSRSPDVSYNGSFVVFDSNATNLVTGDTNSESDVFRWDINQAPGDPLARISERGDGTEPNGRSLLARINDDGDKVLYVSRADNLLPVSAGTGDTNGLQDAYLWESGVNSLVSRTWKGEPTNGASQRGTISHDGSVLGYETFANNLQFTDNNGVSDVVARPTFKPEITGVTAGTWVVGETSVITLAGSFSPNSTPIVGGNGVLAKAVTSVSANSLTLEITTAATATPGVRQIWITSPSPQLGTNAPLGSAAQTSVTLQP